MKLENFSPLSNLNRPALAQGPSTAPNAAVGPQVDSVPRDTTALSGEVSGSKGQSEAETPLGWNPAAFEESFASPQSESQSQGKSNGLMATLDAYVNDSKRARGLEDTAFASKDRANVGMEGLHKGIVGLPKDDQKALGQSMFYKTAAATGLFKAADQRDMTAQEIREQAANLSPEARQEFEKEVKGWAEKNQIPSQIAMSEGAVEWAAKNFDKNAPPARNKQLLGIAQSGKQVWDANNAIVNSAVELNKLEPGKGTGLYGALNAPTEEPSK